MNEVWEEFMVWSVDFGLRSITGRDIVVFAIGFLTSLLIFSFAYALEGDKDVIRRRKNKDIS